MVDLSSNKGCREPMPPKRRPIVTPHVMGRFAPNARGDRLT